MYTYLYFQASSPSSGTFTALGVYLLTGLLFVFGSLLEFALVLLLKQCWDQTSLVDYNILHSQGNQANRTFWKTRGKRDCATIGKGQQKLIDPHMIMLGSLLHNIKSNTDDTCKISQAVDTCAFYVFGILFLIFNCIYWIFWFGMLSLNGEKWIWQ